MINYITQLQTEEKKLISKHMIKLRTNVFFNLKRLHRFQKLTIAKNKVRIGHTIDFINL